MISYLKNTDVNGNIQKKEKIIAVYTVAPTPPTPPTPSHGNYYTGEISDVGHSIYLTVDTMEKEDID